MAPRLRDQSPGKDPLGGHVRLYWHILDSAAWRSLKPADQCCYLALLRALKSEYGNGDLSLTLSRAKHYGIASPTTLAKSLRALQAVGLIALTRRGGAAPGGERQASLYRVTHRPTYARPEKFIDAVAATNEWRKVDTLAHGKALIKAKEQEAKEQARLKAVRNADQKLELTTSKNGVVYANFTTKIGV